MSHYALDLPEALLQEAQAVAQAAQTSLDDFVRLAIAEKIAAARTAQYFQTRAARADPKPSWRCWSVLSRPRGPSSPATSCNRAARDRCLRGMAAIPRQGEAHRDR